MGIFNKLFHKELAVDPVPAVDPEPVKHPTFYEFIISSENEKTDKALAKYQKFWTDPEDKHEGMKLKEFKEEGLPGDKNYLYPTLDVEVELKAAEDEDGQLQILGYICDGSDLIYVGRSAKNKAKKIKHILEEENPRITAELCGGKVWKIESSGYVDDRWEEDLKVRVTLEY